MSTRQWRPWRRSDDDFHREIQAHLELETDRLIADGLDPDTARRAAQRTFGNVGLAAERVYERSRWMWLDELRHDVRYAVRTLRRSLAYFATTVATLAIAIALVTVLFAGFNAAGVVLVSVATVVASYLPARRAPSSIRGPR
jgi:hypothetical protein